MGEADKLSKSMKNKHLFTRTVWNSPLLDKIMATKTFENASAYLTLNQTTKSQVIIRDKSV